MDACTIISRRELARARVLADTLHSHDPDVPLTVLLLDRDSSDITGLTNARVLGLDDLLPGGGGLLAASNPPGALALALLPSLVEHLLDGDVSSVLYLSAGERVLGPLDAMRELVDEHGVVLVSRAGSARPSSPAAAFAGEGARGSFSRAALGFRASATSAALLAAWPRCFADLGDDGAYAARAWLERVSALGEDVRVLRDPGYGLDAWTLADRSVAEEQGALLVDGHPACLLDLEGLDPRDPPALFSGEDRISLSSTPALVHIVESHAQNLLQAGFERDAQQRPPFAELEDGLRLTPTIRAELTRAIAEGAVTQSPFSHAGRVELYEFLNRPAERGQAAGLTCLHLAIWNARADLRSAYIHLDGPDGPGFAGWLCVHGPEQEGLVAELLPPTPATAFRDANPFVHEDPPRWGVNVAGFLTAELGVGEAARLLIAGLDATGVPALPIQGDLKPSSRQGAAFDHARPDEAAYPINLLCINGDGVPVFAREAGKSFFEGRYTIALWWWEVGDPPASWTKAYDHVDEVWVGSRHIYDALAPTSPVPVVQVTLPVLEPRVAFRSRANLGLPEDGFLFLYVYDYHSVAARKNPLGLIEAFRRAFAPGSGAKLVLKSINGASWPAEHERVMLAAREHPDISLIDAYMSGAEKNALIAHCDCYVSLHRSEGFGLTPAEAMLLEKPVIATRYGGTLEFMSDANSYLVDWTPVEVGEGAYPYPPGGVWAEPDLDHAARLMREVRADPEQARLRAERGRGDVLEHHSAAAAGATMARRLEVINARLEETGLRSLNLRHMPGLVEPEPAALTPGTTGGPMTQARRRVGRYMAHRVASVDARLREIAQALHDEQNAQYAQLLAELRRIELQLAETRAALDASTRREREVDRLSAPRATSRGE